MTSHSRKYDGQRYKVEFIKSQWYTLIFRISIETRRWRRWHTIGKSCHINIIAITTFSLAIMETKWKDKKNCKISSRQRHINYIYEWAQFITHRNMTLRPRNKMITLKRQCQPTVRVQRGKNQVAAFSDIQQMTHCISWKAAGRSWSSSMTAQTSCCRTSAWK